jgi:hypothetical protein
MRKWTIYAALVLISWGCDKSRPTTPGPECTLDVHCSGATPFCHQESCVQCFEATQCECHEVCDNQICVPLGAQFAASSGYEANAHGIWQGTTTDNDYTFVSICESDNDCSIGQLCNPLTKGCVEAATYQTSCSEVSPTCPSGQDCALTLTPAICLPTALCQSQSNCCHSEDYICDAIGGNTGLCVPTQNECTPPEVTSTCPFLPREKGGQCNGFDCCSDGEFCSHIGTCVQCVCDADCDQGLATQGVKCYLPTNTCKSNDYCKNSSECLTSQSCDLSNETCKPTCTADTQSVICNSTEFCDTTLSVCKPLTDLPCTADSWEPNSTSAEALSTPSVLSLPALNASATLTGFSLCSGDTDWYTLSLEAGDRLTITGAGIGDVQGLLDIFGPDAVTSIAAQGYFGNSIVSLDFVANVTQTHYLRVSTNSTAEGFYTLTLAYSTGTACADTIEATTTNNTPATATLAYDHTSPTAPSGCTLSSAGDTYIIICDNQMTICAGDVDYYRIHADTGSSLDVRLDNFSGNLDLALYGPFADTQSINATTALVESATSDAVESVNTTSRSANYYLAKVFGRAGSNSAYDIQIQITEPAAACAEDPFDQIAAGSSTPTPATLIVDPAGLNDTSSDATQIALVSGQSLSPHNSAMTLCKGDADWYQLGKDSSGVFANLDANQRVVVNLTLATGSAQGVLALSGGTDPANLSPATFNAATSKYISTIALTAADTAYYLKVEGSQQNTAALSYELSMELQTPGACDEDILGDTNTGRNDNPQAAFVLSPNDGWPQAVDESNLYTAQNADILSLCPGNDDWYRIVAPASTQVLVWVEYDPTVADISLTLYDASVASIATDTAGTLPLAGKLAISQHAGRGYQFVRGYHSGSDHYIALSNLTGWPLLDYKLGVQFVSETCVEDGSEENDTYDTPSALILTRTSYNTQLERGVLNPLAICSADADERDFYSVGLESGDLVNARVHYNPNAGGLDLKLHAPGAAGQNGSLATATDDAVAGSTGLLEIEHTADAAGDYILRVLSQETSPSQYYALEAEVTRACVDDTFEPSPPAEIGTSLSYASSTTAKEMTLCYDEDWFKVTVPNATNDVTICLQYDAEKIDLLLAVYGGVADDTSAHPEPTGAALVKSEDRDGDQRVLLDRSGDNSEKSYYIRAYPSFTPAPDPFYPPFPYNEPYQLWIIEGDESCPPP